MLWSFSTNNLAGTAADVIYALKELLKGVGWTVTMSGGGTGSGLYSATGDCIANAGQMNGILAWFVIRQHAATGHPQREFLFQRKQASDSGFGRAVDIFVSAESGYVAAGSDEDTKPANPADGQQIAGTAVAFHGTPLFPPDDTFKFHLGCNAEEPWGWYAFWKLNGAGGNPDQVYGLVFDPLHPGTFPSADRDPAVYNCTEDSVYGSPFSSTLYSGGASKYWYKKGLPGEVWCSYFTPGFIWGLAFAYDIGSYGVGIPAVTGSSGQGLNPHSSKAETFPIMWGRGGSYTTARGWKGIGTVQRWRGADLAPLTTISVDGVRTRIVVGEVTLPWPDVAPLQ